MSLTCPSLIGEFAPGLCRAIDVYCERTSPAFFAEPVNALTNLAYLVAAFAAWRLEVSRPNPAARVLIAALVWSTVAVGTGSALFHTIATSWASWADVFPILAFMLVFLWITVSRFLAWPAWPSAITVAAFIGLTFSLEAFVPETVLWGGAYATPTLFVMVGAGIALKMRRSPAANALLAAAGLFVLSFTFRTLDMPLCARLPFGTHFMWHLLNATLLFLLTRAAILYAPPPARPRGGLHPAAVHAR